MMLLCFVINLSFNQQVATTKTAHSPQKDLHLPSLARYLPAEPLIKIKRLEIASQTKHN